MPSTPIKQVTGKGVFVPGDDIDTDRIIPARFMKCITFDGLEIGEHTSELQSRLGSRMPSSA